jgi:hypothetical protein
MTWIDVSDFKHPTGWINVADGQERARWYCRQLELGHVLFFADIPFDIPEKHLKFLLSQHQTISHYHKNISYSPRQDSLRGFSASSPEDLAQMRNVMRNYSREVTHFLSRFLSPYAENWSLDLASFRALEEKGRQLPQHKRNDLIHIDAFPSRPTGGSRILRVFTNINPNQPRLWITTDRFDVLARRFTKDAGLNQIAARASSKMSRFLKSAIRLMRAVGLPVIDRSPYDKFMLKFHNYLKENSSFQEKCVKTCLEFPPRSTWIVFTDAVPHAVLSGQFALEHTYIVPISALLLPHKAPIRVLEELCGRSLSA